MLISLNSSENNKNSAVQSINRLKKFNVISINDKPVSFLILVEKLE